jgi:hypothetical protein
MVECLTHTYTACTCAQMMTQTTIEGITTAQQCVDGCVECVTCVLCILVPVTIPHTPGPTEPSAERVPVCRLLQSHRRTVARPATRVALQRILSAHPSWRLFTLGAERTVRQSTAATCVKCAHSFDPNYTRSVAFFVASKSVPNSVCISHSTYSSRQNLNGGELR